MPYKDREKKARYQKEWMAARRKSWLSKNGPCSRCGSDKNLNVHHKDPNDKVSNIIWSWSEERRNEELVKCEVLCSKCHHEYHKRPDPKHGTNSRYTGYRWRCRCDKCRQAHAKVNARYKNSPIPSALP